MAKTVSASEFKARCLQRITGMQQDGEPVAITRRGKVVAELAPKESARQPLSGMPKGDGYRFDADPQVSGCDPGEWHAPR